MSMINVSPVLNNPRLQDTFVVLRRAQVVNSFGESKRAVTRYPVVRGVVYPEGKNDLERRAEAQTNEKTITVFTRFAMRGESTSANDGKKYQPDVIIWHGDSFLVVAIEDWSSYARGFVKVTAISTDIVDQPTAPQGPSQDLKLTEAGFGNDAFGGGQVEGQQ